MEEQQEDKDEDDGGDDGDEVVCKDHTLQDLTWRWWGGCLYL